MPVTIIIRGDNRVRNNLRRMASNLLPMLDPALKEFTEQVAQDLTVKPYPPERAQQTYVRTGRLGKGWHATKIKTGVHAVQNVTRSRAGVNYPLFVIGDVRGRVSQRWMFQGRWWTFRQEVQRRAPKLTKKLMAVISKNFKK